ncbi:hypothetical protein AAG570_012233, partial [Ranatra chinensis]
GPSWSPVVGSYLVVKRLHGQLRFAHLVWERLTRKYGQLLGLRLGKDLVVIASGSRLVKHVLTSEVFDARPDGFFFRQRAFGGRYGLAFIDGDFFTEQKKFCMRHLRNLGLGRNFMEQKIAYEVEELVQNFMKNCHNPVRLPGEMIYSVANSFWTIVAGERFSPDDDKVVNLFKLLELGFKLQDMSGGVLNQMPFLRHVAPEWTSYNKHIQVNTAFVGHFRGLIEEHRRTLTSSETRDLIDAYLQEIDSRDEDSTFSENQLIIVLMDLLMAGTESTTSTIGFGLLYLIHYPDVQRKIQEEIDAQIGTRPVQLGDRPRTKYIEAFLMELQRFANVAPSALAHRAKYSSEVQGYIIPQGTLVLANLYSVHMDKDHWKDPEVFRPERFLNDDGKIVQDDWLLPFGTGKRRCMGETLARSSMYLFITTLMSNFTISPVPGAKLPPLEGCDGAAVSPRPFECMLTPRHEKSCY